MQQIRIAVDAQSGDYGYPVIVEGCLNAVKNDEATLHLLLCGDTAVLRSTIEKSGGGAFLHNGTIQIVEGSLSGDYTGYPIRLWRQKKESSIIRCIALQKEGMADVSVSAGDIRILIGASIFILGRQKGIKRPALATFLPTVSSRPVLLLDVGANISCRTEHLVSFAMMGYSYVKNLFSLESPSIMLLNVGTESSKGTKTIIDAGKILSCRCSGYRGFIEGNRVLSGDADVIACDGFSGNILLKACESFYTLIESVVGSRQKTLFDTIRSTLSILNAENYGAVPLLGLQGLVMKAHGSSSSKAITHAIRAALHAAMRHDAFYNPK
ncbi:MAG: phosphate acyltransferase [Chitinivibrionales bacterium]|nr:phosphate acyltransferase [Chitinivibrionales bacterium]